MKNSLAKLAVAHGRHVLAAQPMLQLDQLRHTNCVKVERLRLALGEIADQIVVVRVGNASLRQPARLIPDEFRLQGKERPVINKINAIWLAEQVSRAAGLEQA